MGVWENGCISVQILVFVLALLQLTQLSWWQGSVKALQLRQLCHSPDKMSCLYQQKPQQYKELLEHSPAMTTDQQVLETMWEKLFYYLLRVLRIANLSVTLLTVMVEAVLGKQTEVEFEFPLKVMVIKL